MRSLIILAERLFALRVQFKIAVYKDVPLRRGDQIVGEAFATNIVEIPRNFERRKWFGPISIGLRIQGASRADDRNKCPQEDDPQTEPVLLHVVQLQFVGASAPFACNDEFIDRAFATRG